MSVERRSRYIEPAARFDVGLDNLSPRERLLSDLLYSAALDMKPIYGRQLNVKFPGANLYPKDSTREEIERAAKTNLNILSEYTVVKRKGKMLIAIPYHVEYEKLLKSPSEKLKRAAEITDDSLFAKYLSLRADSLVDGDYEKSDSAWLAIPHEPIVDIVIGPYDRYLDELFSRKYTYQGWSGIKNVEKTEEAQQYVDAFLKDYGWQGSPVKARVDNTRILATIRWNANSLPCQREWREKYGNKITIFDPSFSQNFENRLPILHGIWEQSTSERKENLERVARIFLFGHEASHPVIRREGDEERLKSYYSVVSEQYCDTNSVNVARKLIGMQLSEQEWNLLIPSLLASGVVRYRNARGQAIFSTYMRGEAATVNFLLSEGSIAIQNSTLKTSTERVVEGISKLAAQLEYLMGEGTEEDSRRFYEQYGNVDIFARFTT